MLLCFSSYAGLTAGSVGGMAEWFRAAVLKDGLAQIDQLKTA